MALFTYIVDLQDTSSACLTVRDWEMLTETVQIQDNFIPLAFARLTELTVQELEVEIFCSNWFSLILFFLTDSLSDSIQSHQGSFANTSGYSRNHDFFKFAKLSSHHYSY